MSQSKLIIGKGTASETEVPWHRILQLDTSRRKDNLVPDLHAVIEDPGRTLLGKLTFGAQLDLIIDGATEFSGSIIAPTPKWDGALVLDVQAVGNAHVVFRSDVLANKDYLAQDTAAIVTDLISLNVAGFTTSGVAAATGTVLSKFSVHAGERVGDIINRLSAMDGYRFTVDASKDVKYYSPSATSQLTIRDADLLEQPSVEYAAQPPRNTVGVAIGAAPPGVAQSSADSYLNIQAAATFVAQAFRATSSRIQGLRQWLDKNGSPSALRVRVYRCAKNIGPSVATLTGTNFQVANPVANINDENDGTNGQVQDGTQPLVAVFDFGAPVSVIGARFNGVVSISGSSSAPLDSSPDNSTWTTRATFTGINTGGTKDVTAWFAGVSARYWRITISNPQAGTVIASFEIYAAGYDAAHNFRPASLGGQSGADTYKLTVGADLTINTLMAPIAGLSQEVDYPSPDLACTSQDYLVLVLDHSAATGPVYWKIGYNSVNDLYTDGRSMSSTDSGTTWTNLGKDLAFVVAIANDVGKRATATNAGSVAKYGTWAYDVTLPDLQDLNQAQAVATQIANNSGEPLTRCTLVTDYKKNLDPTEKITVSLDRLNVHEDEEIVEIHHELAADGWRTRLVTGKEAYSPAQAAEDARRLATVT
ncbi:MAG: hypothetical protein ACYDCK_01510 [Thermoplasmatota archaeon]